MLVTVGVFVSCMRVCKPIHTVPLCTQVICTMRVWVCSIDVHLNPHASNLIPLDAGSNLWLKYSSASDQNPGWICGNCCGTLSEGVNRVFTWLVGMDLTIICLPFSLSTPLFLLSIEHMERGEQKVNLKAKLRVLKAWELALNSNISDTVEPGEKLFVAKAHFIVQVLSETLMWSEIKLELLWYTCDECDM